MVEGGRQIGAAGLLYSRAEGQSWPCRWAWLVASQRDSGAVVDEDSCSFGRGVSGGCTGCARISFAG